MWKLKFKQTALLGNSAESTAVVNKSCKARVIKRKKTYLPSNQNALQRTISLPEYEMYRETDVLDHLSLSGYASDTCCFTEISSKRNDNEIRPQNDVHKKTKISIKSSIKSAIGYGFSRTSRVLNISQRHGDKEHQDIETINMPPTPHKHHPQDLEHVFPHERDTNVSIHPQPISYSIGSLLSPVDGIDIKVDPTNDYDHYTDRLNEGAKAESNSTTHDSLQSPFRTPTANERASSKSRMKKQKLQPWGSDEVKKLTDLVSRQTKMSHIDWKLIATELGRTDVGCMTKYYSLTRDGI